MQSVKKVGSERSCRMSALQEPHRGGRSLLRNHQGRSHSKTALTHPPGAFAALPRPSSNVPVFGAPGLPKNRTITNKHKGGGYTPYKHWTISNNVYLMRYNVYLMRYT